MKWTNVRLIFVREVRDQLRDRRTLFTIAVLPMLLYPLLGMIFLQVAQFTQEHPTAVLVLGSAGLPKGLMALKTPSNPPTSRTSVMVSPTRTPWGLSVQVKVNRASAEWPPVAETGLAGMSV